MNKTFLPAALSVLLIIIATDRTADAADWSYSGELGPEHWGKLSESFLACEAGRMQSPIDLGKPNVVADVPVSVDYAAGELVLLNKGKGLQANFAPGSYLTSSGRVFSLLQVHFHTPSEHRIDGEDFPLVAHFVHATDNGELAVLGILFEEGDANDELQKIVDAAANAGAKARTFDGVTLDPKGMLPDELEVFRYMGSLTTPPCSEGVNWHVAEDTLEASEEQIAALRKLSGDNARPLQPLNGRLLVAPE